MKEKRSEPRFMCADLVKVRIQDADGAREVVANLEDISPSGACIQLEAAALEGADVEMICAKCLLRGKVRYCRFAQLGYDVGIEFDKRRSWNRSQFEPKHLLEIPAGNRKGPG
ncbi:MAG: PilZ domain-containing protein [Bryobacteraceae bacterium]